MTGRWSIGNLSRWPRFTCRPTRPRSSPPRAWCFVANRSTDMVSSRIYLLLLVAWLVLGFGLGAGLQPRHRAIEQANHQSDNFFSLVFGDSRRIFANSFSTKADAYYHSGYYPTIFDNRKRFQTLHV